jgi:hypothetical protein
MVKASVSGLFDTLAEDSGFESQVGRLVFLLYAHATIGQDYDTFSCTAKIELMQNP